MDRNRPNAMQSRAARWRHLLLGAILAALLCSAVGPRIGLDSLLVFALWIGGPMALLFLALWLIARRQWKRLEREADELIGDLDEGDDEPENPFESGHYPTL